MENDSIRENAKMVCHRQSMWSHWMNMVKMLHRYSYLLVLPRSKRLGFSAKNQAGTMVEILCQFSTSTSESVSNVEIHIQYSTRSRGGGVLSHTLRENPCISLVDSER